jgi:hypothetical protein
MNSDLLTAFIVITSVAIVLQAVILVRLYLRVTRTTSVMETVALEMQRRATPLIENARDILADATPKIKNITTNFSEASTSLRQNATTLGDTAVEMAVRAKNKVVQADEMLTRTLERVEKTTGAVQNSVLSPVRHVNGVLNAITVGIGSLLNQKRETRKQQRPTTSDEGMFV